MHVKPLSATGVRDAVLGLCAVALAPAAAAQTLATPVGGYLVPGEQTADFNAAPLARTGVFLRDVALGPAERARPEYEAAPIPVGGFNLTPQLGATAAYVDNVYAQPAAVSDAVFTLAPSAVLESNWTRHYASVFGRVMAPFFLDHSGENKTDYAFGANGRYDVASNLGVSAGASFEQDTEPRTSTGSPASTAEPVRFTVAKAYLGGVRQFNRLRLTLTGDLRDYTFDNAPAFGGGTVYQRDQSRTQGAVDAQAEYALSPGLSAVLDVRGNNRNFRNALPGELSRDSSGYDVTAGANFQLSRLLVGSAQVGYLEQDYKDAGFRQVSGLSLRGFARYTPTALLSLSASGSRSIQDAEVANSSGYLASVARGRADYEFLRQLILSAEIAYENDAYRGLDRNDDRLSGLLQADYRIGRGFGVVLAIEHIQQRSSGALRGVDYDVNRFSTGVTYRF